MKTLKSILMIFSITMIVVMGGLANAQETTQQNYLKLKGKILANYTADIQVWKYQPDKETWSMVYDKTEKSKYAIRLNPQCNYQIFFTSNKGQVKVMHVDAGNAGPWLMKLNVNFNSPNTNYAKIYQDPKKKHYTFSLIDKRISTTEGLSKIPNNQSSNVN